MVASIPPRADERIDTIDGPTAPSPSSRRRAISNSFLNELKPTVVVRKQAIGGSGSFDFTLTGEGIGVGGTTNIVQASPGTNGVATWTQLVVGGTYTLTESTLSEWHASLSASNTAVHHRAGCHRRRPDTGASRLLLPPEPSSVRVRQQPPANRVGAEVDRRRRHR
jgi:hypothetical protein